MTNDPGDRHVIAAAVKCGAEAIVTFKLRHFSDAALDTWNIEVQHPDEFLVHLYRLNPDLIVNILHEQATFIGRTLTQLLAVLKHGVPNFAQLISDSLGVTETEYYGIDANTVYDAAHSSRSRLASNCFQWQWCCEGFL